MITSDCRVIYEYVKYNFEHWAIIIGMRGLSWGRKTMPQPDCEPIGGTFLPEPNA